MSTSVAVAKKKPGKGNPAGASAGRSGETRLAASLGGSERLLSLDVFRGLTIAGMILVNNPGSWGTLYAPLGHAPWDGWTPTDFIFPFFLFIVGVAMTFSFDKRLARGAKVSGLLGHVFARASVLFLLGMILAGFPNFRLITPYILAIAGIQMVSRETPPQTSNKWVIPGLALLATALTWFVLDFRYFNGPTPRGGFDDLFPLADGGARSAIRIPGVLQRIALCYMAAALIMVWTKNLGRAAWALALINVYWLVMKYIDAPADYVIGNGVAGARMDAPEGAPFPGRLNDWLDVKMLGAHLYSARPDPEGILSTLPAIATTLLGVLTGTWIQRPDWTKEKKAAAMFVAGNVLLIAGAVMDGYFPINKKIWTSSYVVFLAGWALTILSACYWMLDVKGRRRWSLPFVVLGTNAILAFFGSGILARLMGMIKLGEGEASVTLRAWLYSFYQNGIAEPKNASLLWALSYVALWVMLITPLYRKRIFLKV